jgi:hypothetical protein
MANLMLSVMGAFGIRVGFAAGTPTGGDRLGQVARRLSRAQTRADPGADRRGQTPDRGGRAESARGAALLHGSEVRAH